MRKFFLTTGICITTTQCGLSAEVPALFKGIFVENQPRMAEAVVVVPPAEIEKFIAKVEKSAQADPAWFKEFTKKASPAVPLPYHEKLGLSKEEYDSYIAVWGKREFKVVEEVPLILRHGTDKRWSILNVGGAANISTLRYSSEEDTWKSSNGMLKRIDDIKSSANSVLGAWTGKEWKFQEETMFSKIKENFAFGETGDGKYTLIVYRAQEITSEGRPILDKSLVLRIPKTPATPQPTKKKK